MNKPPNTSIKITNDTQSMELTFPWDANIDEWRDVLRTILTFQGFHQNTIDELFNKE